MFVVELWTWSSDNECKDSSKLRRLNHGLWNEEVRGESSEEAGKEGRQQKEVSADFRADCQGHGKGRAPFFLLTEARSSVRRRRRGKECVRCDALRDGS